MYKLLLLLSFACGLTSCISMIAPDFYKEEQKQAKLIEKNHPEAFKELTYDNHKIGAVVLGTPKKPKIIFVHGSPGDWSAFERQIQVPSLQEHALLISVDRLGYGRSNPGEVERSLDKQAQAVMKWFDFDDPSQPIILVGHSYGGPVITRIAMLGDPRIKEVVLLAGAEDPSLEQTHWYQYPADWLVFSWMIPDPLVVCNREILALKPELVRILPDWNKITAHVVVIQGLKDDLVDPRNAAFVAEKLKGRNPTIMEVPDMDHIIPVRRPDLIEKVLTEGLTSLR